MPASYHMKNPPKGMRLSRRRTSARTEGVDSGEDVDALIDGAAVDGALPTPSHGVRIVDGDDPRIRLDGIKDIFEGTTRLGDAHGPCLTPRILERRGPAIPLHAPDDIAGAADVFRGRDEGDDVPPPPDMPATDPFLAEQDP